jgi:Mn2+/Fe2+ NRAMP family transporter
MMLIINKKDVMGEYRNKWLTNVIGWATIVILIGLTGTMVVSLFQ